LKNLQFITLKIHLKRKGFSALRKVSNMLDIARERKHYYLKGSFEQIQLFFLIGFLMTAIGGKPKPEICFLPGRLR